MEQQIHPMTCILVTGTAHDVIHADATFCVSIVQLVVGAVPLCSLTIHAVLLPGLPWPHPVEHLPVENQVVHFTGELCLVDNNEPMVVVDFLNNIQCKCDIHYCIHAVHSLTCTLLCIFSFFAFFQSVHTPPKLSFLRRQFLIDLMFPLT